MVPRGRCRWNAPMRLRRDDNGYHSLYAGADMRSAGTQEAFISGPFSDAMDFSGDGGWSRAGAFCTGVGWICEPLSEWNDQYSHRHWPDHHDVSAAREGALREAGRSVSQKTG